MESEVYYRLLFHVNEDYDPESDGYILDVIGVFSGGVVNPDNIQYIYDGFYYNIDYYKVKKGEYYFIEMSYDMYDMYDISYNIVNVYQIEHNEKVGEVNQPLERFDKKVIEFELNPYI